MKKVTYFLFFACCIVLFCGCSSDSNPYPPVKLEFITLHSDKDAVVSTIELDNGTVYTVNENRSEYTMQLPYTAERVVAYYEELEGSQVNLWSVGSIVCHSPQTLEEWKLEEMRTDPVSIQSVWLSGKYINFTLGVLSQNGGHTFLFVSESRQMDGDTEVLHVTLYHDRNNDVEGYTQKLYASLPLHFSDATVIRKRIVTISINTYKDGVVNYTFTYPE